MEKILLIEDDYSVGRAVVEGLGREGYQVRWARDGEQGYAWLCSTQPRLLILDWMLPYRDGVSLLKSARKAGNTVPTLFLTARVELVDRIDGLEAGADDYLCKPFAFAELLARVRALLRRQRADRVLQCADLILDTYNRNARRGKILIELTGREYALLAFFLLQQKEVITRDMLARDVWKVVERATPIHNVIDVQIARLRRKLEEGGRPRILHTLRGIGFYLSDKEIW